MAIDTAAKRYSAINVGSPQRGPAVIPSGTVGPRARSAVATLFAIDATSAGTAPTITTTSLPNVTNGASYNQTLVATGDTPITWAVTIGALPNGLSLNASTGAITGTPTVTNTFNFTVEATNATGSDTQALSITVVDGGAGGGITYGANQDLAYKNLGALGYTQKDLIGRLVSYYKANGATSDTLVDAERQFLIAQGAVGKSNADLWTDYLVRVRGYSQKDLVELLRYFWSSGA